MGASEVPSRSLQRRESCRRERCKDVLESGALRLSGFSVVYSSRPPPRFSVYPHRLITSIRYTSTVEGEARPSVECNSYGLTMWEVKTKYIVGTLGPIG